MIRARLGVAMLLASSALPAAGAGARASLASSMNRSTTAALALAQDQKFVSKPPIESAATHQSRPKAETDIKTLQGNWQVVRWEDETGEQVPAEELKQFTFHFEGDQLTMHKFKDDAGTRCQFRLDASKDPKWIDLGMPSLGPGATVLEGIYSLEGDILNLCIISGQRNGVAPPRPTQFKTGPGEKYAVLALKRIP